MKGHLTYFHNKTPAFQGVDKREIVDGHLDPEQALIAAVDGGDSGGNTSHEGLSDCVDRIGTRVWQEWRSKRYPPTRDYPTAGSGIPDMVLRTASTHRQDVIVRLRLLSGAHGGGFNKGATTSLTPAIIHAMR
ncbi:uncharacterized protein LACBIDRAFT_322812 [Laccaria bicolor S238N-H82]|uniref:Predicted protein n=1 Tax=Laccaria bicolor (strain S238N-H82 / ATCC MYA-4686) TaxID=486041 RepID=B0CV62_LACBS|nr:uncharacterized protein LACBIDRAFT_322812 [Laccaria bicolor S238N-H82]EDR13692.1 predicted protein [Laccaria bicolor S238N-H82]|eukprot:XP_001876190.1 predicted protein [Laccaria bicolor S238N-H82]